MLKSLQIMNFRNSCKQLLTFSRQFNAIYGENAAGKTSLLEAIYVLSTSKSFRTHHPESMILKNNEEFTLFSRVLCDGREIDIGLQRHRERGLKIHLDGSSIRSITEISQLLPAIFIGADSHRILMDGPKVRRQFLDFGLFHVKHSFFDSWRAYHKILAHRNMALKARAAKDELLIWNQQLAEQGEHLNTFRQDYVGVFMPTFERILEVFFDRLPIKIDYLPGWDAETSLLNALNTHVSRETQVGHTLFGPHRADLRLSVDKLPVEEILSQGQLKLVSYALRLAQGMHLYEATQKSPIFLIDDLPSELDIANQQRVMRILQELTSQVFVTGIHQKDFERLFEKIEGDMCMFHVKQGVFEEACGVNA